MSLSLLDYHSLEDGELNRLWYEENDPRARDAFRTRWWLGGDPIAGNDLLTEYHTLMYHRCIERGVLAEEHQLRVFRRSVEIVVAEFPSDPIAKFEDFFLPVVDRAIDEVQNDVAPPTSTDAAAVDAALDGLGDRGALLREWAESGAKEKSDADHAALLEAAKELLRALDGDAATNHPLVRTDEPPPSKLDESVAVPHFGAGPLFRYAFDEGLSKRENEHIEWCQPCRERCVGALLLLRRVRPSRPPALPKVSPQFEQILQEENPAIPSVDPSRGAAESGSSNVKNLFLTLGVVGVVIAAIVVAAKLKS